MATAAAATGFWHNVRVLLVPTPQCRCVRHHPLRLSRVVASERSGNEKLRDGALSGSDVQPFCKIFGTSSDAEVFQIGIYGV